MKHLFYNLAWQMARPILPILLRKRAAAGKEVASRISERFGKQGSSPSRPGAIWLHAVSVGESIAAIALVKSLAELIHDAHFIITTNTVTAAALVEKEATRRPEIDLAHRFVPLDHPDFVDRFLQNYQPVMAIFIESDYWPNLILRSGAAGIMVVFASAQMSRAAFARWAAKPTAARQIFSVPQMVFAVSDEQASHFRQLGTPADRISVLGSLKTGTVMQPDPTLCQSLTSIIGGRKLFLAASTHAGEDGIMIAAAKRLGDDWLTIIAPRHPDRGDSIAAAAGGAPQRSQKATPAASDPIYIMDILGEMGSLFSLADVVFLGASLVPKGGHNPLEPASFGLPIITGPHIFKNATEFASLRDVGVVFDLCGSNDKETSIELADLIIELGNDTKRRVEISRAAKSYAATADERSSIVANQINPLLRSHKQFRRAIIPDN
jgi:3-deoxy-D-manno-octulosonic-acid transferase